MCADTSAMVAVDLGGTRLRAAVFDAEREMRSHIVERTPAEDPEALTRVMQAAIDASGIAVAAGVVGAPGVIDHSRRVALVLPQLPAWGDAVRAESLERALGIPVAPQNDADLAALGEYRFGAGRGVEHLVYVTCSTGVGAGVIVGGRLLHTRYSLAEVGHTLIDWRTGDTVESYGCGTALATHAGIPAGEVERRARHGDAEAQRLFREMADAFSAGVLTLIQCFQPDRVVVGGGVAQAGELLLGPVRERVRGSRNVAFSADAIVPSTFGDNAGLMGGLAYWLTEMRTDHPEQTA